MSPSSIVQETYLRACRKIGTFRGRTEAELMMWIRRILIRCLLNHLERGGNKATYVPTTSDVLQYRNREPVTAAANAEMIAAARAAMNALPPHYRLAVEVRHFERRSFSDVGGVLGCSEEAARKTWLRAQVKLGQALKAFQ